MIKKQNIPIAMGQGLDQKTDSKQIAIGKYLNLQNTVFQKGGLLQKRNGYGSLPSLGAPFNYLTTFNGNLTAIGTSLNALASGSDKWIDRGTIRPIDLNTLPLIRSNTNQSQCDSVISSNGLVCTAYTDQDAVTLATVYRYAIADAVTGQNIIAPVTLSATGPARVFFLVNNFIIIYSNGTALQYVAVNINTLVANSPVTISSSYTPATGLSFDATVANNSLYIAWYYSTTPAVIITSLSSNLILATPNVTIGNGKQASTISVCVDSSGTLPVIWVTFFETAVAGWAFAVDTNLAPIRAAVQWANAAKIVNIATAANNGTLNVFFETNVAYLYDTSIPTHTIASLTIDQITGTVSSPAVIMRSVGLASKAFVINNNVYFLTAYQSDYQPSYFLADSSGAVVAKLAYSNGGGYLTHGLPSVSIIGTTASIAYLIKDTIIPVNKSQGATNAGLPTYSQLGVNLASFNITTDNLNTAEIGNNLNLSGGLLWAYDGYSLTEQNFNVWPDNVESTTVTGAGGLIAQTYFYVATYEWSDNQGNLFRSAPSIPVKQVTTTASSTNTIYVPKLRLTYKTANPVKIVLYRWSTAQQTYYQTTSVLNPILNDQAGNLDYVTITDTNSDAQIIGNSILYTTGGIVENIGPPAASSMTLYKSRLFLVDSEDRNLLWFSKQVIEATPVEMSDLFTIYVAPTTSAASNTGFITALSALDDKLIIFKNDAIYYLTGTGPDNTGANNDFSEPVFITSTVGCSNPQSIVFMPNGLLFQSDKGIWLLGRDLSTTYIGAPVEDFNQYKVTSAVNVPGTNQIRMTLSNGVTLMYDYYFQQWGTFVNVPAVSSCIYQGLHTFINSLGATFQETVGKYLDGSKPVLISFTTGWINPAGLQGYIRSYAFYLLGQYLTPYKLSISIGYDYNSSPTQITTISPDNFSPAFGVSTPFGAGSPFGGSDGLEQWRVFLNRQRCLSFQITINEIYDPSFGAPAGAGLTLSGLNLLVGLKSGWNTISSAHSVGGG